MRGVMPEDALSYEVLLLMANLTQIKSREAVLPIFVDAINTLQDAVQLALLDDESAGSADAIDVATHRRSFGRIVLTGGLGSVVPDFSPLLRNAIRMVAIILENLERQEILADDRLRLGNAVKPRTADLLRTNEKLRREVTIRREAEAFIQGILESVEEGFVVMDRTYPIVSANRAFCEQLQAPLEELLGRTCHEVACQRDRPCFKDGGTCSVKDVFDTGKPVASVRTLHDVPGNPFLAQTNAYPMKDESGRITSVIQIITDITEKKNLEAQLLHAQKMESIGRFAGGVAHDFNNILSAILGYSDLILLELPQDHALRESIEIIRESGEKAATLTKQLLTFSRKQVMDMRPVDLNAIVENMSRMIERVIGEDIVLTLRQQSPAAVVRAEPAQMEQVLMNLAVNARDAMPGGGGLTIETGKTVLTASQILGRQTAPPGPYVVLSVSDTGAGIEPAVEERIFEPFFTTKEHGKGTGLGLSTVYGIVNQHNGYISLDTKPGVQTTFNIFFPAEETPITEPKQADPGDMRRGTETVLVADDNASVRRLVKDMLVPLGYVVLMAPNGEEALEAGRVVSGRIDLLVTDVVMPGMNGKQLAEQFQPLYPEVRVLFMSGYVGDALLQRGVKTPQDAYIQKPFKRNDFLGKLRQVLDV
jgi:PAS domain S-box-containing protein